MHTQIKPFRTYYCFLSFLCQPSQERTREFEMEGGSHSSLHFDQAGLCPKSWGSHAGEIDSSSLAVENRRALFVTAQGAGTGKKVGALRAAS